MKCCGLVSRLQCVRHTVSHMAYKDAGGEASLGSSASARASLRPIPLPTITARRHHGSLELIARPTVWSTALANRNTDTARTDHMPPPPPLAARSWRSPSQLCRPRRRPRRLPCWLRVATRQRPSRGRRRPTRTGRRRRRKMRRRRGAAGW